MSELVFGLNNTDNNYFVIYEGKEYQVMDMVINRYGKVIKISAEGIHISPHQIKECELKAVKRGKTKNERKRSAGNTNIISMYNPKEQPNDNQP